MFEGRFLKQAIGFLMETDCVPHLATAASKKEWQEVIMILQLHATMHKQEDFLLNNSKLGDLH